MSFYIYYNDIIGNPYDRHRITLEFDNGEKYDLICPATNYYSNYFTIYENSNSEFYSPILNTVYTPSGNFQFSTDTSFFDPMSVNYICKSFTGNFNDSVTQKAHAYPCKLSGMLAMNHYISCRNTEYITPFISPNGRTWGSCYAQDFGSVVEEDLKKEIFNLGFTTNIEEIESQYNKLFSEICDDPAFNYMRGVRYPITSDPSIDANKKIALSMSRTGSNCCTKGPSYEYSTTENSVEYNKFFVKGFNGGNSNNWWDFNDYSGKVYPFQSVDPDLIQQFYFVDEMFTLEGINSSPSYGNIFLLPVYNYNNKEEVYFKTTYYATNTQLPPISGNLLVSELGNMTLWKDTENNKWMFTFSAQTICKKDKINSNVGHFECSGDKDPWASSKDNGLVMKYVDGFGHSDDIDRIYIYPYRMKSSSNFGPQVPYLKGDEYFESPSWYSRVGINIRPKYKLYKDDFMRQDSYVCVDPASYTILI